MQPIKRSQFSFVSTKLPPFSKVLGGSIFMVTAFRLNAFFPPSARTPLFFFMSLLMMSVCLRLWLYLTQVHLGCYYGYLPWPVTAHDEQEVTYTIQPIACLSPCPWSASCHLPCAPVALREIPEVGAIGATVSISACLPRALRAVLPLRSNTVIRRN